MAEGGWRYPCVGHLVFRVELGRLVGKGRPRFTADGSAYTPKATRDAESAVENAFRALYGADWESWAEGPVHLRITAYKPLARTNPKHWIGRANLQSPDWDNVAKLVCDALNGVAYRDDRFIDCAVVEKKRSRFGDPAMLKVEIRYFREER